MRACKNNEVAKKAGGTKGGGEKVGVAKRGVAITFKKILGVAKMEVAITFLDFWGWRKKSWRKKKNQWVEPQEPRHRFFFLMRINFPKICV